MNGATHQFLNCHCNVVSALLVQLLPISDRLAFNCVGFQVLSGNDFARWCDKPVVLFHGILKFSALVALLSQSCSGGSTASADGLPPSFESTLPTGDANRGLNNGASGQTGLSTDGSGAAGQQGPRLTDTAGAGGNGAGNDQGGSNAAGGADSNGLSNVAGSAGAGSMTGPTTEMAPLPLVAIGLSARPNNNSCLAVPPPTGEQGDSFPQFLSEAGCMDSQDPSLPGPGLIPYGVNMPLWSDAAGKKRWMALPAGETIEVQADGNWVFPIGSVLVKAFYLGSTLVETRLMMRHEDGQWGGYSYAWEQGSSDAQLLPTALRRAFGDQEWTYPSRENCGQCHGDAPGSSLGPKTAQLDGLFEYPDAIAPQLDTLSAIGVLNVELFNGNQQGVFPSVQDEQVSVEDRARAYLDVNCSHCHQPGGVEETIFDLRATTALSDARLCDVAPSHGNFGLFGASLILPGDPEFSLVSVRMHSSISTVRMPQIGTALVDDAAVDLVDTWIANMTDCN